MLQKYYKENRKAQTAEQILADQIRQGEEELQYFDTVFDALSRASSWRELSELQGGTGRRRLPAHPAWKTETAPLARFQAGIRFGRRFSHSGRASNNRRTTG